MSDCIRFFFKTTDLWQILVRFLQARQLKSWQRQILLFQTAVLLSVSLGLLADTIEAAPFSDDRTLSVDEFTIEHGRGPFDYAHLFSLQQDDEDQTSLAIIFRARTSVILRLKKPVQLSGFTSSITVRVQGFRGGETLYAMFNDRSGKHHRMAVGRLDDYGYKNYSVDIRGRIRQRAPALYEQSYIEFTGWMIEPDLRQPTYSSYILLQRPVFNLRPYDLRIQPL